MAVAGVPGITLPITSTTFPHDEAIGQTSDIFTSAQNYAAAASTMVLQGMNAISSTDLPELTPTVPVFNSPGLSNSVIVIPPPVLPTINTTAPPTPDFNQAFAYSSAFLTALRAWMSAEVANGNLGLTAQTQDDIFNTGAEKDLQAVSEAKNQAAATWAKLNWGKADGVLLAAMAKVDRKLNEKQYQTSKAIRLECEKNTLERLRMALEQGVKLEETLMDYAPELMKTLASAYGAEADAYKTEIKAQMEILDAFISKYEGVLKGRVAQAKLGNVTDSMNISYAVAEFEQDAANAEISVKEMELNLNILLTEDHLKNMVAAEKTKIGAQLFTGAFDSCHVQAHLGYSYDLNYRASASTSESYETTYKETVSQ